MAEAALPRFLQHQRWYPAKDAGTLEVALSALLPLPSSRVPAAVAVWQVTPSAQPPLYLFLPLALVSAEEADPAQIIAAVPADVIPGGGELRLVEAFSADSFVRAWLDLLVRDAEEASGSVRLRVGRTERLERAGLDRANWTIRRGNAEQSNTSIRIGDAAILKVIRKLESGIHPELEVGRFLTETAKFGAIPPLLAWAELDHEAGAAPATLSVLQSFIPNEGDGWTWVLRRLARATEPGNGGAEALEETTAWLRRLGRRTAEMHAAFATETNDPAFRPEPVDANDIRSWVATAEAIGRRALDGLAVSGARTDPQIHGLADAVLARRDQVAQQLQAMLSDVPALTKTRYHGDYHLGQVLVASGDAVIIDFEGEPLRPLEERRAKNAALRDVAGMLRSFSYAAAAASRGLPEDLPRAKREAVRRRLADWEAKASQAFVDAYFEAAHLGAFCPGTRVDAKRIVRFFMLEKALYELAYELANRPDWVAIPLRGVLALLGEEATPATTRMHRSPSVPSCRRMAESGFASGRRRITRFRSSSTASR